VSIFYRHLWRTGLKVYRKQVSDRIVEEKWGEAASPITKAESDPEGDVAVICQLWTSLLRKCFLQTWHTLILMVFM
jgi:hypothetical protein